MSVFSEQRLQNLIWHCTRRFNGADVRWSHYQREPMTDKALLAVIRQEMGCHAQFLYDDCYVSARGGRTPLVRVMPIHPANNPIDLMGERLLDLVRAAWNIAKPGKGC